jgi:cobalt/nickel transport protein
VKRGLWILIGIGLAVSVFVAGVVSFYAASSPDGLEKVAQDQGFLGNASSPVTGTLPTANYTIAGVDNQRLSGGLAGILGVIVMATLAFGLFWFLGRGKKGSEAADASSDVNA